MGIKRRIVKAVSRYLIRAAKVLIVSEPIAIFYAGYGKSLLYIKSNLTLFVQPTLIEL